MIFVIHIFWMWMYFIRNVFYINKMIPLVFHVNQKLGKDDLCWRLMYNASDATFSATFVDWINNLRKVANIGFNKYWWNQSWFSFPKFCKFYTCTDSWTTCKFGYRSDHSSTNRSGRKLTGPRYHRNINYNVRTV